MAQKEMMLRLLLKGKRVGYEKKEIFGELIVTFHSANIGDKEQWWDLQFGYKIEYDSFELGIKVGDEWWFEGDKAKRGRINGILRRDHFRWVIVTDLEENEIFHIYDETVFKFWKRIGNIHEGGEAGDNS